MHTNSLKKSARKTAFMTSFIPSAGSKEAIASVLRNAEQNKNVQGHICINDSRLFNASVESGVYGFPGQGNTTLNNLKLTAWRAISSLYNIGSEDLIFLYRTSGNVPGAQEFHGVFRVLKQKESPLLLLHPQDEEYLPRRSGKTSIQFLPFRFLFECLTKEPISIPNDLRNKTYKKNNNLEIVKALSQMDPSKPRLWGFRHPSVMNIGAARKSSIVAISNKQVRFLLELLSRGIERPLKQVSHELKRYDLEDLPPSCVSLDAEFLSRHFYDSPRMVNYEAELYAYIIHSLKNPTSPLHKDIVADFDEINKDLEVTMDEISTNVILEVVMSTHIQEEVDILLCDRNEKNFLIMEVKNDMVSSEDLEQAEKYVQLVNHRFPGNHSVSANVIGTRNPSLSGSSSQVKVAYYAIENISRNESKIRFRPNT